MHLIGLLLVLIVVVALVRAGASQGPTSAVEPVPTRGTFTPGSVTPGSVTPGSVAPGSVAVGAVTIGTVAPVAILPKDCPTGYACAGYRVTCPGVSRPEIAFTAQRGPAGTPRGMAVLFSGDFGQDWWAQEAGSTAFLERLRSAGFVVVQLRWETGWSISAPGEDAGTGHLACRPASMIRWIHDHRFVPLQIPARPVGEFVLGTCR